MCCTAGAEGACGALSMNPQAVPLSLYRRSAPSGSLLWLNGEHAVQHLTLALIPLGTYYILYTIYCILYSIYDLRRRRRLKSDPPSPAPPEGGRGKIFRGFVGQNPLKT